MIEIILKREEKEGREEWSSQGIVNIPVKIVIQPENHANYWKLRREALGQSWTSLFLKQQNTK